MSHNPLICFHALVKLRELHQNRVSLLKDCTEFSIVYWLRIYGHEKNRVGIVYFAKYCFAVLEPE